MFCYDKEIELMEIKKIELKGGTEEKCSKGRLGKGGVLGKQWVTVMMMVRVGVGCCLVALKAVWIGVLPDCCLLSNGRMVTRVTEEA